MSYKFLDEIKAIEDGLRTEANQANEEKQRINARQAEIEAELSDLKPRLLRAQSLKSRNDLICANCFIYHDKEIPLNTIPSDTRTDLFRCGACGAGYELEP